MKIFKKIFWQNLVKTILIMSLLGGCAGIPGGNVKLEDYPKIDVSSLIYSDLSYERIDSGLSKSGGDFTDKITKKLSSAKIERERKSSKYCYVRVSSSHDYGTSKVCQAYGILAGFTLFAIPAYCYWNYQAQASLIHYPSKSSLKDRSININPKQVDFSNNKIQIKQTKKGNYLLTEDKQKINEGEYFLDENNNLAKLLKTYELKDKVHEYWSLIALLGEVLVAVIHPSTIRNSNISTPERAKIDTENNISEALVRSILNDAKSFPECQKNDDGKDRDQKNLSNK